MFDDPKKELKELEGQLLAAEEKQETAMLDEKEFEALYNEIRAEFAPRTNEPPVRNFANGYGRNYTPETAPAPTPAPMPEPEPEPEPRRKKHKFLRFIITVELLALAAFGALWAMTLLR